MSEEMMTTIDVAPSYLQGRAQPDTPGASWPSGQDYFAAYQLGLREAAGDVVVNARSALQYSVLWRCVNYISSTIAALGWPVFDRSPDGRSRLPIEDNIAWTLGVQANPEMSAFEWRQVMLKDALTVGNGVSEIERTAAGKPLWLWRIDPARVSLERDEYGRLVYRVADPDGGTGGILDPANVFHLKGLSPDGLVGFSPVTMMRRTIELGLSQQGYGLQFFRNGPSPGGFLKAPGNVPEEERRAMSKSFSERYGGSRNAGKVPVLSGGLEFVAFQMANKDVQWIEGQNLSAEEICRAYGVPAHKAGILTRSTNNNIEQQSLEAVYDCLLPWCRRLESEANIKLFGRVSMGRRHTRLDLSAMLKGDSKTHTENLARQVTAGLATPNEGREELDRNPEAGGDVLLIQGAMAPLERILEGPVPTAPPAPDLKEAEGDGPPMPEAVARTFGALLSDAYGRLLRVEADKARRADNRGELGRHVAGYYTPDGKAHVAATIRPVLAALLLALGRPDTSESWAHHLADDHAQRSAKEMAKGIGALAGWETRPVEQAARNLQLIWESA